MVPLKITAQEEVKKIILDTDMGNDIDDALALAMLYNYQKKGVINIEGICISKANPHTVPFIDMFNRYYGFPNIPLGYIGSNGKTPDGGAYLQQTLQYETEGKLLFPSNADLSDNVPEAFSLQRKILAEAEDHSIDFIVIGFSSNVAKLLKSKGDEYSPLDGIDLVKKKAKTLYMMAGMFSQPPTAEYNVVEDIEAAKEVFNQWPGPIIVSGFEIGETIKFPAKALLDAFPQYWEHPLVNAYFNFEKMPYNRETWDLTIVLEAIEGDSNFFKKSPTGKIVIDDNGISHFHSNENGLHKYLIMRDKRHHERLINTLTKRVCSP